jgi:hypothetical protein
MSSQDNNFTKKYSLKQSGVSDLINGKKENRIMDGEYYE